MLRKTCWDKISVEKKDLISLSYLKRDDRNGQHLALFLSMETRKTFFWNVSDSYLGFRLFGAIWKTDGFNEKLSFYRKYQRQHIRASSEQNAKVSYEIEKILSCVVIRARCFFILPENEMGLRMTYESISEVLVKGYKSDATATKI